jgi:hypothetical protein
MCDTVCRMERYCSCSEHRFCNTGLRLLMIKYHKCAQLYDSSSQRVGLQIVYEVTYSTWQQETEEKGKVVKLQGHDKECTHKFIISLTFC